MKPAEKGFALIELLVAITIMAAASVAVSAAIFQILRNTERNNDYMTVVRQVESAGYWISRDAQMALSVNTTANLTLPNFLVLSWTTWSDTGVPTYHSASYYFDNVTDSVGKLKRNYWSSAGANQTTLVAQYIYYDPNDVAATSNTSYQSPLLMVKLTALFEEFVETREYKIKRRPGL